MKTALALITTFALCVSMQAGELRPPNVQTNLIAGGSVDITIAVGADKYIPEVIAWTAVEGSVVNVCVGNIIRPDQAGGADVTNQLFFADYTGKFAQAVILKGHQLETGDRLVITNSNLTAIFQYNISAVRGN